MTRCLRRAGGVASARSSSRQSESHAARLRARSARAGTDACEPDWLRQLGLAWVPRPRTCLDGASRPVERFHNLARRAPLKTSGVGLRADEVPSARVGPRRGAAPAMRAGGVGGGEGPGHPMGGLAGGAGVGEGRGKVFIGQKKNPPGWSPRSAHGALGRHSLYGCEVVPSPAWAPSHGRYRPRGWWAGGERSARRGCPTRGGWPDRALRWKEPKGGQRSQGSARGRGAGGYSAWVPRSWVSGAGLLPAG